MAGLKQIAGAVSSWTAMFGSSDLNSLANTDAILSSLAAIDNTGGDLYLEWCAELGLMTSGAGAPYVGLYLALLNQDGTYGDGRWASAAVGPPLSTQYYGQVGAVPSVTGAVAGVWSGTQNQLILPRMKFKPILYNLLGGTLASSGNQIYYQTTNLINS